METPTCHSCKATLVLPEGPVGRRESCSKCGADVRVCLNCKHYDVKSYNECREPQAERVLDKTKGNFCDLFALGTGARGSGGVERDQILRQLDDLFKK